MKLKILGCSGGVAEGLETTSYRIDDALLLDAGTGVAQLPLDELLSIKAVLLTHSHLDHIVSLPLMLDTRFGYDVPPLKVYLQQSTLDALKAHIFNWVIWPDFSDLEYKGNKGVEFIVLGPDQTVEVEGYSVQMIPVSHTVPCAGYRVEKNGKALAFTGDTSTTHHFWDVLNQQSVVDLLIAECSFKNEDLIIAEQSKHYCPNLLVQDVNKLNGKTTLGIVHIKPGHREQIEQELAKADIQHSLHYFKSTELYTV